MRFAIGFIVIAARLLAVEMTISPSVITQCVGGTGQATIYWRDAGRGPVQVRLNGASGPAMTGWELANGQAETGPWVADGTAFVLVDADGMELARIVARVRCNAVVDPPGNASYWPLTPGNRWVYRYDSRIITAGYEHWRVVENVFQNGKLIRGSGATGRVFAASRRPGRANMAAPSEWGGAVVARPRPGSRPGRGPEGCGTGCDLHVDRRLCGCGALRKPCPR